MSSFRKLFKKDHSMVPRSVDDLIFLESSDVERIRRKLNKNFNLQFKFRWRYHPQEDILIVHYAAARGSAKGVGCLVDHGADVTTQTGAQGLTPLHFAVLFSNISVMEEIVNRGADVNAKEFGRGYTPLHYAVERKNLGAVKQLMELLADQDLKDIYGRTPLDIAEAIHCEQIARILKSWREGDELKSNVSFLASEQRRQNDKFDRFKSEVNRKFEDLDYWKNTLEHKVSEIEKYQDLRRSMRIHSSKQQMFYQNPCPSAASSVNDLTQIHKVKNSDKPHVRSNLPCKNRKPALSKSVKNLVSKFEQFQESQPSPGGLHGFRSGSFLSINSASTVSGYQSGGSSRPESSLSTRTEKGK